MGGVAPIGPARHEPSRGARDQYAPHLRRKHGPEVTMRKIASGLRGAGEKIRELTEDELGAISGGTILMVNGGGNSPSLLRPAEFVVINKV
jgi:hypothetical protein